jgi:hypothetical protein
MNSCQGVETLFSAPLAPQSGDGRSKWFPGKRLRRLRKGDIREKYLPQRRSDLDSLYSKTSAIDVTACRFGR